MDVVSCAVGGRFAGGSCGFPPCGAPLSLSPEAGTAPRGLKCPHLKRDSWGGLENAF